MAKKYLVTGGTGFIGSALVKRLVKEKNFVRVFDNDLRGVSSRLAGIKDKIELVAGDIRNPDEVQKACRGMDSVIHLAYINGTEYFYKMPELVLEVGVKGIINVIDGCMKENVKELVLASSSEVYQTPKKVPTDENAALVVPDSANPRYSYGAGKIISEMMAINYGRKHFNRVLIFRPHNVYGPDMGWEHVIPQMSLRMKDLCKKDTSKKIKFTIQGSGKETRAFVYIDDFTDGLMIMLKKGMHLNTYNIGTMEEISITDVAKKIGKCFGKDVEIMPSDVLKGSTPRRCPDIVKLKKMGYKPKISFDNGLARTVKWYNDNAEKARKINWNSGKI
ncbi:MAG: NAD-dependent epimerase/dehydratase family protein [Nanoarchaeota archaeon]